ncbi:hypothetical protein CCL22_26560 [Pseudomonas syringae]|nr:hypothetical protein CCL22_26560 [Pseudomonas syringae]
MATPSRTSPLLRPLGRIKTASCPRGRGEIVREDGRSGDACSKAWRPLRGQVRSYARWAESKAGWCVTPSAPASESLRRRSINPP